MRKLSGLVGALALAGATMSCGGGGSAGPPPPPPPPPPPTCAANTFCLGASSFAPTTLTVPAGTTVSWKNDSGVLHDVTWDNAAGVNAAGPGDGSGDLGTFSTGTHTRVINTPGTYGFHCNIHAPGMKGTLTVQ
jgi:plastocyanin